MANKAQSRKGVAQHEDTLLSHLQERDQQFTSVLRAIPDLVIGLGADGQITFMSESVRTCFGVEDGDAGDPASNWTLGRLAEYDAVFDAVADEISRLQSGEGIASAEVRSEARKRTFLINCTTNEYGCVIVMRDMSLLRELNRFKDDVLKLASHDLRSPLALIIGYASLVALDLPPDSAVLDYVNSILSATERMTGLLDGLMRVEHLRSTPIERDPDVSLSAVIHDAVEQVGTLAEQRSQQIDVDLALDGLPPMTVNRGLIREVIENLLTNGLKYSEAGKTVYLRGWYEDDRVNVTVRDEGMGISAEQMSRIFEAFYRGKQPGGQKSDGRGLGLNFARTILHHHSGDIWVESEVGKGSLFGFWLPLT